MSVLDQVQADVRTAMKAGERERVGALRMVVNALQQAAKGGNGDETAVLRRERKRRLEAAGAYRSAGREDRAAPEEREAELISSYLPSEISDDELDAKVEQAIEEAGASGTGDIGRVMGALMPTLGDRADGRRVSDAVRSRLAAEAASGGAD